MSLRKSKGLSLDLSGSGYSWYRELDARVAWLRQKWAHTLSPRRPRPIELRQVQPLSAESLSLKGVIGHRDTEQNRT